MNIFAINNIADQSCNSFASFMIANNYFGGGDEPCQKIFLADYKDSTKF